MAIMVIVTSVMLFNQGKFNSSTILRSLAYSVALSVRQAQVYGTSVLGTSTPQVACSGFYAAGVCYVSAYGVYFNAASPTQYTIFADLHPGTYDSATVLSESIKTFSLNTGYVVSKFCATGTSGNQCSNTTISSLVITFKRPNPDAQFTALDINGQPVYPGSYTSANIYLQNQGDPSSLPRSVTVTNTGLISAQ
jgi:hypothetical protein